MESILNAQHKTLENIEDHARHDKALQFAQLYATYRNLKDSDRVVDTLESIERAIKDGVNAQNKLVELSKSSVSDPYYRYTRGEQTGEVQQRGLMRMFDLSPGKSQGWLGNIIRNKVAQDQFIRDEQAIDPTLDRGLLKQQFRARTRNLGEQDRITSQIDRLKATGKTDEDIARSGLGLRLDRASSRQDALFTTRPAAPPESVPLVNPPAPGLNVIDALSNTTRGLIGPVGASSANDSVFGPRLATTAKQAEKDAENLRLMQEQNETLVAIKDNTAYLPMIYDHLTTKPPFPDDPSASIAPGAGGGVLGDIAGAAGGRGRSIPSRRAPRGRRAPIPQRAPAPSGTATPRSPTPAPRTPVPDIPKPSGPETGTKWGRFMKFVERKSPSLFAKLGPRLAGIGALAAIPVAGWVAAAIGLGLNLWLAYDLYTLWEEFNGDAPTEAVPVEPKEDTRTPAMIYQSEMNKSAIERSQQQAAVSESGAPGSPGTPSVSTPTVGATAVASQEAVQDSTKPETAKPKPPIEFGSGDASDMYLIDGQTVTYRYSPSQPYVWNSDDVRRMVKDINEGKPVDFGSAYIPKDESHKNPLIAQKANTANAIKPAPRSGDAVYSGSAEVQAAQSTSASAPVVISAPTNTNVNQTSNYAVPSPPRNTDSSVKEYNTSRFAW